MRKGLAVAAAAAAAALVAAAPASAAEDRYIVVFKPGTKDVADLSRSVAAEHDGQLKQTFKHALKGFVATLPEDELAELRSDPSVQSVERDRVVEAYDTQTGATWGLDRIDQRALPLDGSYTDGNEGAGVHAYVVDTGIRADHAEFSGRMGNRYDAVTPGGTANDCNGHGTHVAGTVGGTTYGVADKVTLHAVRVLDCNGSGTTSGVIAGVDWVTANHVKPAVANMSLGGSASAALDTAVNNSIAAGVTYAVAAGNSNANACTASPARAPAAITVGATTNTDARASFSNFGTCLDVFAPGQNITSAWHTGGTNTISGTSMASPHVAGVAAQYLAANPNATPQAVRDALFANATKGVVTNAGTGSPNALLYTGTASPPPPPPPPANGLVNGGFESGTTGWTQTPAGLISTSKPRSGAYSAWLGGANSRAESVAQTVTVPANGTLTYWWHMTTSETGGMYDFLRVRVYSAGGALLGTLRTLTNSSARNTWTADTVSLAAWAGQNVTIRFEATTDSSLPSSFYVDDVSVS